MSFPQHSDLLNPKLVFATLTLISLAALRVHGRLLMAEEISDAARVLQLCMKGLHASLGILFFTLVLLRLKPLLRHSLMALALVNVILGFTMDKMPLGAVTIALFAYMALFALFSVAGLVGSLRARG